MEKKLSKNEGIKENSRYLRGKVIEELADPTMSNVSEESYELLKFHGTYEQFDRDTQTARKQAGLDKEWQFMLRLKIPAGRLTAKQYLQLDTLSDTYSNGTLRITTRETLQFHCILKDNLKSTIAAINKMALSTLATCGDVVRNVTSTAAPIKDQKHRIIEEAAYALAKHFTPRTPSYAEMWLDGEKVEISEDAVVEPIYGKRYLPRKFKISVSAPDDNSVDALSNDLAMVAIFNGQELQGYNVCMGGGMGMTHNKPETYPRMASAIAFVKPDDLLKAAEAVVKLQRDHGDRANRKHARLKYVVEEKGLEWTRKTLEEYFGEKMADPKPMEFKIVDHMGWHEQGDGKWYLGIPVPSGRIINRGSHHIRDGLKTVIAQYQTPIILTADQNIILCDIAANDKEAITKTLRSHGVRLNEDTSPADRFFLACVALPTCGLALAEAERVRNPLVESIEEILDKYGLKQEPISIRMTGCPNGCARPYEGDIGIVGRMPGHYALFIGGDFECTRLNTLALEKIPFEELPVALDTLFSKYAAERKGKEGFGDFCHRVGIPQMVAHTKTALAGKYKWAA